MAFANEQGERTPGLVSSRLALRWLIAGEWRVHPQRFLATAVAIAVGVALGFAVHLINGSALSSFEGAVRGVNGAADLAVRGASPLGFDEEIYPSVASSPGVIDASPVVSLEAEGNGTRFTLLGLDVIRAATVTPSLVGLRPQGPNTENDAVFSETIFLSDAALSAMKAQIGDMLLVSANGQDHPFRVAGSLPGAGGEQALGVIDIASAQWRFNRLGRLDRLDLKLSDRRAAEDAIAALLPADAVLGSTESEAAQGSALSRAYRVNLDMLALVALLTGGFLVFSAQSLSVVRRLRAFALVRTLGLPRGGIIAAVALEGLLIGLLGASLGLLIGYGLANAALRLFGGDLGAGYFGGTGNRIVFQPVAALVFFLLGVAAAIAGSILPARVAARAAPAAALKNSGDMLDPRAPVPSLPAILLLAAGGLVALAPAVDGLPIFGFVSMALLLAGGVAGVPWLARKLIGILVRLPDRSVPRRLAVLHVHGAPSEAATALCGIVASTALMIAMATMVTSFRTAVDDWLGQVLSADLYLRADGGPAIDAGSRLKLANVPGVGRIAFSRQLSLTIKPDQPPIVLIARPLDVSQLILIKRADSLPADAIPVYASEPASRIYGWRTGDTIRLPVGKGGERFVVAGVWRDYARQAGAVVVADADYSRLTGDATRDEAAVWLAPGAQFEAVADGLRAALPPAMRQSVEVTEPAALRRFALDLFDRSFAVTYLLEAVAILVGLAGVAATVSAQVIARVREFGMLRHLGLSKRQVIAMLGTEGALLGLVGSVAGVLLGGVLSQVLIHVINPQSFNWTMDTHVPWRTVTLVIAALVAAAALTAMLSGRRATAQNAILAVREDW